MPINGYNTGRDVALDVLLPSGPVRLAIITAFRSKQMTKKEESHGIDGVTRFQYIPGGWEGDFTIDRANVNADQAILSLEQLYFGGQDVPPCLITETINEGGGVVSQWQYTGTQFMMEDHGTWEGDKKVTQKLSFCASFRQRIQ